MPPMSEKTKAEMKQPKREISAETRAKMAVARAARKASGTAVARHEFRTKDLVIAFLIEGVTSWSRIHSEQAASDAAFKTAYKDIADAGKASDELHAWMLTNHPTGRGRPAVVSGCIRRYRAQQLKDSDPFIRLPVGVFGIGKRDQVDVIFDAGQIVVRPSVSAHAA